ncbi:DUF4286 family protein [Patulibacter americanus]|uniref:DUF4286 family protein n=1 Tax=Patulibacter americanus TaxID=588672 RepID=UPI0003FD0B72|nr:DUF4286 family protein [Patulibacter americanus]
MTRYIHTVRTRALPGRDAEFHEWYVTVHIPAVLAVDGFASADLYRPVGEGAPEEYLCVYGIETDDLPATQAVLRAASAGMVVSDAMDAPATRVEVLERVGV